MGIVVNRRVTHIKSATSGIGHRTDAWWGDKGALWLKPFFANSAGLSTIPRQYPSNALS